MSRESDNFHNLRFKSIEQMLADFKLLPAAAADLDVASILESCSFPADEAASAETIIDRYKGAGKFFFVIKKIGVSDCIGFINATCTIGLTVNEESMRDHVPEGKSLVIHSVTISHEYRRCGVGSAMLRSYIDRIAVGCPEITRLLLLSKAHLLGFYISCGFQLVGLSSVNHGEVNTHRSGQ